MSGPLRSLSGLMDFNCAARWGSFKLAARELHKTPAAVSLQIRQLEAALGFVLFIRHPRQVTLTEKGQELAVSVAKFLGDLQGKVAALQGHDEEKVLRISTTHSFAIKWLVPRIVDFTRQFPDIDIRIDSNDKLVDLDDASIDVAIRFGLADPLDPALVFAERMVAVYSPGLLAPGQAALSLADLRRFPLIYGDTTETWIQLLHENRVLDGDYHFARSYSNAAVRAQAALAGQGISIVSYTAAYQDLLNGTLKMIACRSAPCIYGYRLLVNRRKLGMPKIERFRLWIAAEMQQMRRALDGVEVQSVA
ncbi:LysR substrate-binding domain-containing protein [Massilia sp. S19_KUP03_FR1]|uniref:LysR substrate-binding domain-containing protein n=1 Tax=Massilia sp. S19_KUP03_FR1 TaxID=3025503 RepID=UPI002FCDC424